MFRTNAVKLTILNAVAYRQKLRNSGDIGLTIIRPDLKQPGIASLSRKTGEPVLAANTNAKDYPLDAFKEAAALTQGLPFKRMAAVKVTDKLFETGVEEKEPEVLPFNEEAYEKIAAYYTDKDGKVSYDLINKDLIKFTKSSTIVKGMIEEGRTVGYIRKYVVHNRFKNIAGNDKLTDKEIRGIVAKLEEEQAKGVFKELNSEIRKLLSANKRP